jgi:hypothetical protein
MKYYKKMRFLYFILLFFFTNVNSQITKGNWMVGGNVNFSATRSSLIVMPERFTQFNWQISPMAGYFFIDKLTAGLKPSYARISHPASGAMIHSYYNTYGIGPFVRYYFLQPENRLNIFSEVDYYHIIEKVKDNPSTTHNGYSILAGPVVYLNSSVGIEFTVGYSFYKYAADVDGKYSTIQVGIGLQVHLEKEK